MSFKPKAIKTLNNINNFSKSSNKTLDFNNNKKKDIKKKNENKLNNYFENTKEGLKINDVKNNLDKKN